MKAALLKLAKGATIEDYEVEELKLLSLECKKIVRSAGIPPEEAAAHPEELINCLYFDVRKQAKVFAEVRSAYKEYRRQNPRPRSQSHHNNRSTKQHNNNNDNIDNNDSEDEKPDNDLIRSKSDDIAFLTKHKSSLPPRSKSNDPRESDDSNSGTFSQGDDSSEELKKELKKSKKDKSKKSEKKESKSGGSKKSKSAGSKGKDKTGKENKKKHSNNKQQRTNALKDQQQEDEDENSSEVFLISSSNPSLRTKAGSNTPTIEPPKGLFLLENHAPNFTTKVRIGKGGFGEVTTAKDKITGHVVAIKILKKKFSEDAANIINEIEALKSCEHPNIVNYIRSYLYNDRVHIIMEYCDGGSLNTLLTSVELNEGQMSLICKGILSALAYLHAENKIHRDIKSDNILLNLDGMVKVADLGLCAELEDEDDSRRSVAGSRFWMAPEMINRRRYGCKVDIWSLGAVLMEMAEKHPPYRNCRSLKAMFNTATKGAPPLKKPKKWSSEFRHFLARCFEMDPERRASAAELLQDDWIVKKATSTSKLIQAMSIVFLGNSIRMNGF